MFNLIKRSVKSWNLSTYCFQIFLRTKKRSFTIKRLWMGYSNVQKGWLQGESSVWSSYVACQWHGKQSDSKPCILNVSDGSNQGINHTVTRFGTQSKIMDKEYVLKAQFNIYIQHEVTNTWFTLTMLVYIYICTLESTWSFKQKHAHNAMNLSHISELRLDWNFPRLTLALLKWSKHTFLIESNYLQ